MKKREAWNLVYHVLGAAAMAALVMVNPLFFILDTAIYAFLREQAQHRWVIGPAITVNGERVHTAAKRTFFDFSWLGWQQVFEIAQWTFGSAVVAIPWYYLG